MEWSGAEAAQFGVSGGPLMAVEWLSGDFDAKWSSCGFDPASVVLIRPGMAVPDFFDPAAFPTTATLSNCALCIVKPHALKAGNAGAIIDALLSAGLEVSAAQMFHFSRAVASEMCEVYKGVVREHAAMVEHLASASCIALEVRAHDAVDGLREVCGPRDVELARFVRPATIRARFGVDRVLNAVHCTDLAEDGPLECSYVFNVLT